MTNDQLRELVELDLLEDRHPLNDEQRKRLTELRRISDEEDRAPVYFDGKEYSSFEDAHEAYIDKAWEEKAEALDFWAGKKDNVELPIDGLYESLERWKEMTEQILDKYVGRDIEFDKPDNLPTGKCGDWLITSDIKQADDPNARFTLYFSNVPVAQAKYALTDEMFEMNRCANITDKSFKQIYDAFNSVSPNVFRLSADEQKRMQIYSQGLSR